MKQPSGKTKRERNADRRERARDIYQAVMARAAGRCEVCDAPDPLQWHHIMGGGYRRHKEAVETTMGLCNNCHRRWEANDLDVLYSALCWAQKQGINAVIRVINNRIAKILETRGRRP